METICFQEAQNLNYNLALPELKILKKNIYESVGQILATNLYCSKPLPAFDNSAMDGYALKSSDIGKKIKIVSTILAGENATDLEVCEGSCIKIMTGAMMPKGADIVALLEDVQIIDETHLIVPNRSCSGDNIRTKGEEKSLGSLIASQGDKITHALNALIASQGLDMIDVYEGLKIGVYSTGDEIVEPGNEASKYQIYNVNSVGIVSLLSFYGHKAQYLGILKDTPEAHQKAIEDFKKYDVVITSGGASVGEADLLEKSLLASGAEVIYHKINLKPGRPMMLATLGKCVVFALPGNPLSGMLNLNMLVIPALERLRGANAFYPKTILAKLINPIKLKNGRVNMVLGKYEEGVFYPYNNGKYGSGAISVVSECNSVALMGENVSLAEGYIKILPYLMEFSDTINHFINE